MCPVSSHRISTCNGTQCNRMLVCTLITHYTYRTDSREQYGTSLPDLIVERNLYLAILHVSRNTGSQDAASVLTTQLHLILTQATDIDIICILKDAYLLWSDITQDTDSQTRTWEWMTGNQMLRHTH